MAVTGGEPISAANLAAVIEAYANVNGATFLEIPFIGAATAHNIEYEVERRSLTVTFPYSGTYEVETIDVALYDYGAYNSQSWTVTMPDGTKTSGDAGETFMSTASVMRDRTVYVSSGQSLVVTWGVEVKNPIKVTIRRIA